MGQSKAIKLGLIGLGGVNRALTAMLSERDPDGERFRVTAISDPRFGAVFNPEGIDLVGLSAAGSGPDALMGLPGWVSEQDNIAVLNAPFVDVLVEASVTNPTDGQPALDLCRRALDRGKSVVTVNKGPVAFGARELTGLAQARGAGFLYEGAVMSGTPVLRTVRLAIPGGRIRGFRGILNGTCNHVLGLMEGGADLDAAVRNAQVSGYAEADPTADVGGYDARLKLAILVDQCLGVSLRLEDIPCIGLEGVDAESVRNAPLTQEPCRWKLIGEAWTDSEGRVQARVAPVALPLSDPLSGVSGAANALTLDIEDLGPVTIVGAGAGRVETAFALYSDLVELAMRKEAR